MSMFNTKKIFPMPVRGGYSVIYEILDMAIQILVLRITPGGYKHLALALLNV
jgi:hypothetical protein